MTAHMQGKNRYCIEKCTLLKKVYAMFFSYGIRDNKIIFSERKLHKKTTCFKKITFDETFQMSRSNLI